MMELVKTYTDALSAIATGALQGAMNGINRLLRRCSLLVLKLLANLVGLGKLDDALKKGIDNIKDSVDKAVDKFIIWLRDKTGLSDQKGKDKDGDKEQSGENSAPNIPIQVGSVTVSDKSRGFNKVTSKANIAFAPLSGEPVDQALATKEPARSNERFSSANLSRCRCIWSE